MRLLLHNLLLLQLIEMMLPSLDNSDFFVILSLCNVIFEILLNYDHFE
jgi:hypothetical protein